MCLLIAVLIVQKATESSQRLCVGNDEIRTWKVFCGVISKDSSETLPLYSQI